MQFIRNYSDWKKVFESTIATAYTKTIKIAYTGVELFNKTFDNLVDIMLKYNKKGTVDLNEVASGAISGEDKNFWADLITDMSDLNKVLVRIGKKPKIFKRVVKYAIKKSGNAMSGSFELTREMALNQMQKSGNVNEDILNLIFGDPTESDYEETPFTIGFKVNSVKLDESAWEKMGKKKLEGAVDVRVLYDANISIEQDMLDIMLASGFELNNISGPIIIRYSLQEDSEGKATAINWEAMSIGISFEKSIGKLTASMTYQEAGAV